MEIAQNDIGRSRVQARPYSPPREHKKENRIAARLTAVAAGLGLLVSLCLLAYTPVCEWFHARRMKQIIAGYEQTVAGLSAAERAEILAAALAYNSRLQPGQPDTNFLPDAEELAEYGAQLDVDGTGMMGYIQIPKINVLLPIYHTTDAEVLEEAVGHIPGSSLPVGGESCHTVLCGHRDLATAYLFHDLDKLEIGDTFTLTVLDQTVTYAVDQVTVVLPKEIEGLAIEDGKDYCTLVTCHPHGSTAYRMLVRGRRVA